MTDQEILKELFYLVRNNNLEEFKTKLLVAEEKGFCFFSVEVDEPYMTEKDDSNQPRVLVSGSFVSQMVKYPFVSLEEINSFFLEEIMLTENYAQNLCKVILEKINSSVFNYDLVRLFFGHIKEKGVFIEEDTLEKMFKKFYNITSPLGDRGGGIYLVDTCKSINGIRGVVLSLTSLFSQEKGEKRKDRFCNLADNLLKKIGATENGITQQNAQKILKGLLKSAIEENREEFEKQLEGAKKAGFDFFNTKLSEDYEFNDITIRQNTSLVGNIQKTKPHFSKEMVQDFLKQGIITQDNVKDLYDDVNRMTNLTISCNFNFMKLSLDYIRNESIQIDHKILKDICHAVINTMSNGFTVGEPDKNSEVQENILKIEEVVKSLVPLLEEDKKKKFEDAFYRWKSKVETKFTTITPLQQKQPIGISPRGWIMIAAGAVLGALALYFLAPLILGATVEIAAQLGLGAAGVAIGGVTGYLTDTAIKKCCSETTMQAA